MKTKTYAFVAFNSLTPFGVSEITGHVTKSILKSDKNCNKRVRVSLSSGGVAYPYRYQFTTIIPHE